MEKILLDLSNNIDYYCLNENGINRVKATTSCDYIDGCAEMLGDNLLGYFIHEGKMFLVHNLSVFEINPKNVLCTNSPSESMNVFNINIVNNGQVIINFNYRNNHGDYFEIDLDDKCIAEELEDILSSEESINRKIDVINDIPRNK